jgi:small-conductance mechanosensitive channel
MIVVRNSKNLRGPVVRYTAGEWNAFIARVKNGEFDNKSRNVQSTDKGIKDQFGTANLRAFLRGLISAATENDETLNRHLKLFRFARATILTVVAMILLGSSIFGAGVAAAVALAGMHVAVAISIGAGGSASFILTIVVRSRSYLKAIFGALSEIESADSKSDA